MKEQNSDTRKIAAIKLGVGVFLILILVLFLNLGTKSYDSSSNLDESKKENTETITENVDYETMIINLKNSNYKYFYKIQNTKINDIEYYNGEIKDMIDTGYYESSNEVYKYSCTFEGCNKVFSNHEEEFEMNRSQYFDLTYLFEYINTLNLEITNEDNINIHNYENNDKNIIIKVEDDGKNITNITINDSEIEYSLTFNYN